LQYEKENKHHQGKDHRRLPPMKKLEENEEVTEEIALASLRRALDQFSSLQSDDGCWPGDFSGIMFIMPGLVRIK
jgi:cycloartenol synthase